MIGFRYMEDGDENGQVIVITIRRQGLTQRTVYTLPRNGRNADVYEPRTGLGVPFGGGLLRLAGNLTCVNGQPRELGLQHRDPSCRHGRTPQVELVEFRKNSKFFD